MVLQGTATHIVEEASTTFVPFGSARVEEPEVSVEHAQQDVCSTSPDEPVAVK